MMPLPKPARLTSIVSLHDERTRESEEIAAVNLSSQSSQ